MQSAEDRRRLTGQYTDAGSRPLVAVLRCAAGIAILFAVAAAPWLVLSAGRGSSIAAEYSGQKAMAAYPNSIGQSRRVFEERRQHAQGRQEATKAALAK